VMRGARIVRAWAGIEGFLPDELPVISSGREPGTFHAFGFSAHGFQLGPVVGEILADLVTEGRTPLPIGPFRIDRFS
ncbi:MAG: FAD-dependent oxidoreductase, partial [Gammaproteobacteria bacterium]|nr:FAD-dependent oxidoreductase [Gammaproteobacteria bacterium]